MKKILYLSHAALVVFSSAKAQNSFKTFCLNPSKAEPALFLKEPEKTTKITLPTANLSLSTYSSKQRHLKFFLSKAKDAPVAASITLENTIKPLLLIFTPRTKHTYTITPIPLDQLTCSPG